MTDPDPRLGDGAALHGPDEAGRPRPGREPAGRVPPQERDRGELERDLLRLEREIGGLERPYLTVLPEAYAGEELLFEWLSYLHGEAGLKGALEAVDYYRDVGWLGGEAADAVQEYLLGLELPVEDPRDLHADDHLNSLAYVARLAALADRERD